MKARLQPNVYRLVAETVEAGIAYGLNRADKHANDPLTPEQRRRVEQALDDALMGEFVERFQFGDGDDE